jgi:uncharacterized protein (TIGR03437 family)
MRYLTLAICLAVPAFAQPTVRNVTNAASNTDPLLPNSSIAQGSMFVIKGDNLGSPAFDVANAYPLTINRAGTSVTITSTSNNSVYSGIIYYSGATQVAAILPSAVPLGPASIRLSYNGGVSQGFNVTVVKNQVGLFTVNTSGAGDAVAFRSNSAVPLSPANPAHPGDTIVLWGTGLGATTGDETQAAQQFDMTAIPVQAWIGGKTADILFRGRNACCTAVDTIYVRVPAGVAGCVTPVIVKAGDNYSNTVTIPTAASGNLCTPNNPSVSSTDLSQAINKTTLWVGNLQLNRNSPSPNTAVQPIATGLDQGSGFFYRVDVLPGWLGFTTWDLPQPRSCIVTTTGGQYGYGSATSLDAGTININGPTGFQTMTRDRLTGAYYGLLGGSGQYVVPGNFNITTGFVNNTIATVTLNYSGPVNWTNSNQAASVDRSAGVTLTWTGGDPAGLVQIVAIGTTLDGRGNQVATTVSCYAPTNDRTFTIPPYVLSAIPVTQTGYPAVIGLGGISGIQKMQGGGMDLSFAAVTDAVGVNTTFR